MGRVSGTTGYRRRIELVTVSPEVVQGELEDDFHHFRVSIAHRDRRVVALDGEAVRHPWSTCPAALAPLRALVGAPDHLDDHGDLLVVPVAATMAATRARGNG